MSDSAMDYQVTDYATNNGDHLDQKGSKVKDSFTLFATGSSWLGVNLYAKAKVFSLHDGQGQANAHLPQITPLLY